MENNNKDFMKNHPLVDKPNQYKDVYGTASSSTREVLTVLFSIIMIVCAVVCFFKGHIVPAMIFVVILLVLVISAFVSNKGKNKFIEYDNNTDAIFKDHEE